jgi:hypothetical protein
MVVFGEMNENNVHGMQIYIHGMQSHFLYFEKKSSFAHKQYTFAKIDNMTHTKTPKFKLGYQKNSELFGDFRIS